jgi:hypothetical protein
MTRVLRDVNCRRDKPRNQMLSALPRQAAQRV